jgi:hypothetical protein
MVLAQLDRRQQHQRANRGGILRQDGVDLAARGGNVAGCQGDCGELRPAFGLSLRRRGPCRVRHHRPRVHRVPRGQVGHRRADPRPGVRGVRLENLQRPRCVPCTQPLESGTGGRRGRRGRQIPPRHLRGVVQRPLDRVVRIQNHALSRRLAGDRGPLFPGVDEDRTLWIGELGRALDHREHCLVCRTDPQVDFGATHRGRCGRRLDGQSARGILRAEPALAAAQLERRARPSLAAHFADGQDGPGIQLHLGLVDEQDGRAAGVLRADALRDE